MKLYTEEQVNELKSTLNSIKLLLMAHPDYQHDIEFEDKVIEIEESINKLTPIELPSDEEIIAKSKQEPDNSDIETAARIGYVAGAKWMRDKIQGGNK